MIDTICKSRWKWFKQLTFFFEVKKSFYEGKDVTDEIIFATSPNKAAGVYDSNGNQLF